MSDFERIFQIEDPTEYSAGSIPPESDAHTLIEQLVKQVQQLLSVNAQQAETIANLTKQLEWFKRNMFDSKSESRRRFDSITPGQYSLFDNLSAEEKSMLGIEDVSKAPEKEITVNSYKRKAAERKKKRTQEELLENAVQGEDIRIYAADEEKICDGCGSEMTHMGWKYVRTEVEHIPEQIQYHKVYVETLMCRRCKEVDDTFESVTAQAPPALIPHSYAAPSLVAYVAYAKYLLCIPNYRLSKHFERKGFIIPRAAMCGWLIFVAEEYLFIPYEMYHQLLKKRDIINADETVAPVNKIIELEPLADENGLPIKSGSKIDYAEIRRECESASADERDDDDDKKNKAIEGRSNCYMWIYASIYGTDKPIMLYDYQPSRAGYNCRNFLGAGYDGYLMTDGWGGYNKMASAKRMSCADHVRRKWFDAIRNKSGPLNYEDPAVVGFMAINKIYQAESLLKGLAPETVKAERSRVQEPKWKEFKSWMDKLDPAGGSALQTAVNYTQKNWDKLMKYLEDGRLPLSNAAAERCAKSYANVRKNMLFHDTSRGARAGAIIKSLIDTAAANNLDPELYLTELLEHARDYVDEPARASEYMAWSDKMQARCINKRKKNDPDPE